MESRKLTRRAFRMLLLFLVCFLQIIAVPARAQSVPSPPQPVSHRVVVRLNEKLVSGKGKAGDVVHFILDSDLYAADGSILATRGTPAEGILLESSGPKNWGRPGKIRLTCDYLILPDGKHLPLTQNKKQTTLRGRDLRGMLNWIRVPLDVIGGIFLVAGAVSYQSATGWATLGASIEVGFGAVLAACGELIHGLFGYFMRGERVTLDPGMPFIVEWGDAVAADGKQAAIDPSGPASARGN